MRWLAPESIRSKKYSAKTDIWSFGVLMWEVFSAGREPYAPLSLIEAMFHVANGGRLGQPPGCPDTLYQLWSRMWLTEPGERPAIQEVQQTLTQVAKETDGQRALASSGPHHVRETVSNIYAGSSAAPFHFDESDEVLGPAATSLKGTSFTLREETTGGSTLVVYLATGTVEFPIQTGANGRLFLEPQTTFGTRETLLDYYRANPLPMRDATPASVHLEMPSEAREEGYMELDAVTHDLRTPAPSPPAQRADYIIPEPALPPSATVPCRFEVLGEAAVRVETGADTVTVPIHQTEEGRLYLGPGPRVTFADVASLLKHYHHWPLPLEGPHAGLTLEERTGLDHHYVGLI